jgi:tetratricopeptide (TPR) repeat protein
MVRCGAVIAVLAFAGCESLKNAPPEPTLPPPPVQQTAPTEKPETVATVPAAPVQPVVATAPAPVDDPLTLVAECLERGDRVNAAAHLESYVRLHPEQVMFRSQLAELLLRLGRDDAAKIHFERFVAEARKATGPPKDHLVHVHTRLMEIAQRQHDAFAEAYHRGIGLLVLVKEEDGNRDRDAEFCEEMLCKAMKALAEAKELNPGEARARMYLAEVYDRMGNRRAADAERAAARTADVPAAIEPTLKNFAADERR